MKKNDKQTISKRKWWFNGLKKVMKIRYKKPKFIYLGQEISNGSIYKKDT